MEDRVGFRYTRHIFLKGFRKELVEDDLYDVVKSYKSEDLGNKMEKEWKQVGKNSSMTLLLWKCFGKEYLVIIITLIIPMTIAVLQPKTIKKFISYFTKGHAKLTKTDACLYGAALVLLMFIKYLYTTNYELRLTTLAFKIRAGFTSLIYRQVLKMKSSKMNKVSVGRVVTSVTRDVSEFETAITFITLMLKDCTVILMVCIVLYTEIGWLFLILVGIIIVILLTDAWLANIVRILKIKSLRKTDERYQATKEVLEAIKLVKMYVWQNSYNRKISNLRKDEVSLISKINFLLFAKMIIAETVYDASWYLLVAGSIWMGLQANAGTLFLIMSSMNSLYYSLKLIIPNAIHRIATLVTIFKRLGTFLEETSCQPSNCNQNEESVSPKVSLQNLEIKNLDRALLSCVSFDVGVGLTAITGPVGSGKTLLLRVVAREYDLVEGNLEVNGRISFASQEPWIFPSTIKQNILFGSSFRRERYFEVLRVCALLEDLQNLKDGDETIVADRGDNLSKGQQARINLARAVYKDCDIYLLDDCLTSLDVVVANFVFQECMKTFLKNKLVVMVTQNQQHIESADNYILLNNDTTSFHAQLPKTFEKHDLKSRSWQTSDVNETNTPNKEYDETTALISGDGGNRIYAENQKSGSVKFGVYNQYFGATGGLTLLCLVVCFTGIVQFLRSCVNKLESQWINTEQTIFSNSTSSHDYESAIQTRNRMFYLLPTLFATISTLMFASTKLFWILAGKASNNLHRTLLTNVMNTSSNFFDGHSIGNVLNRFSEDLLYIDERLPSALFHVIRNLIALIGIFVLISISEVALLLPCVVLGVLIIFTRLFYLRTGRALKRLEFASRSPLIGHITATIEGLTTIRISKNETTLRKEFDRYQDVYTSASYIGVCCEKAFIFVTDLYTTVFLSFVIIFFLILDENVAAGKVGLVISQTILCMMVQVVLSRGWTDLENRMTTVERVLEYSKQKQEEKAGSVFKNWPSKCTIKYENVNFSYKNDGRYVLKNLNFSVQSGEKVAIVGRTASGKTSLASLLLRLYDTEGTIFIDDVDIKSVPIDFLRSQISVIPQEPIMFSGSLRHNIDPYNALPDDKIWNALKAVNLSSIFSSLDETISENCTSLSVGQKQLICLCRVLTCKNKIIILDEVTANVDSKTEETISKVIDEHFCDSTMMIITHNLEWASRCNKVLVLDNGNVAEFGNPSSLLRNKSGA